MASGGGDMTSLPTCARRRLQPCDFTCTRGSRLQTPPLRQDGQRARCSEPHDTAPTTSAGASPAHTWRCTASAAATAVASRVRKGAAARRRAQRRRQDGTVTVPASDNACGGAGWKGGRRQCAARQGPLKPPADRCRPRHRTVGPWPRGGRRHLMNCNTARHAPPSTLLTRAHERWCAARSRGRVV